MQRLTNGVLLRFLMGFCALLAAEISVAVLPAQEANSTPQAVAAKAQVKVTADGAELTLKAEERVALMFVVAIDGMEENCGIVFQRLCTLGELTNGISRVGKLRFDPLKTDQNYTYKLVVQQDSGKWEVSASPKKPGLKGFFGMRGRGFSSEVHYNPKAAATEMDKALDGWEIGGDSFTTR